MSNHTKAAREWLATRSGLNYPIYDTVRGLVAEVEALEAMLRTYSDVTADYALRDAQTRMFDNGTREMLNNKT